MKKKPVSAIIQARLGSTRLPGKVMRLIAGRPILEHLISRLKRSQWIGQIIVATTDLAQDEKIVRYCRKTGIACLQGSENDVLDRFYHAAQLTEDNTLVRLTADTPFLDIAWLDSLVQFFMNGRGHYDYAAFGKSFPEGQNAEVFSRVALEKAWKRATKLSDREHVTAWIWRRKKAFNVVRLEHEKDHSQFRWTIDEESDLRLARFIAGKARRKHFSMEDIISILEQYPAMALKNAGIVRDEGYLKSLSREQQQGRT